jgi:prephenate dehydratase
MLPVENSLAGPVDGVLALLPDAGLKTLEAFALPIRIMLMALPAAPLHALRSAASHPVALKQCRRLIAELRLREIPAFDTAGAARLLAEDGDRSRGVLASRAAAERWGLTVLRSDVHDRADNVTTFTLLEA